MLAGMLQLDFRSTRGLGQCRPVPVQVIALQYLMHIRKASTFHAAKMLGQPCKLAAAGTTGAHPALQVLICRLCAELSLHVQHLLDR
jgi:hypothetical protein